MEHSDTEEYEEEVWENKQVAKTNMLIEKNVGAALSLYSYILTLGIGFAIDAGVNGHTP